MEVDEFAGRGAHDEHRGCRAGARAALEQGGGGSEAELFEVDRDDASHVATR
jgi:hypothetical protein